MPDQILFGKGGIVLAALVFFLLAERLYPVAQWKGGLPRVAKNLSLALFNALAGPLIVIPVTVFAADHASAWRPEVWSGATGLVLDVLLLDLWIYWWHRMNHVVPFLWRFHAVHHLDQDLDASSALRFHVGEVVLSALVRAVLVVVAAIPLTSVAVFEVAIALAAIFHHSNVRLPAQLERLLSLVIVTPSIHWIHHHAVRRDTDSSYSTVLSVWDRVFGSRSQTQRSADLVIGLEGERDVGLLRLLTAPFRATR